MPARVLSESSGLWVFGRRGQPPVCHPTPEALERAIGTFKILNEKVGKSPRGGKNRALSGTIPATAPPKQVSITH